MFFMYSCGSDSADDIGGDSVEHYTGSHLVGMWKSGVIENSYVTFIFTKEGKVTMTFYENDKIVTLRAGDYAYDSSSKRLIVRDNDGSMTMNLSFLSATQLIIDVDGTSMLFKKQ